MISEEERVDQYKRDKARMDYIDANYDRRLAKVESLKLGFEDHGMFTLYIYLDYGGSQQGFGGYGLSILHKDKKRAVGTAEGLDFIIQILQLFGVSELQKIIGRTVYALKKKDDGYHGLIKGLLLPEFDGYAKAFLIEDWVKEWGLKKE